MLLIDLKCPEGMSKQASQNEIPSSLRWSIIRPPNQQLFSLVTGLVYISLDTSMSWFIVIPTPIDSLEEFVLFRHFMCSFAPSNQTLPERNLKWKHIWHAERTTSSTPNPRVSKEQSNTSEPKTTLNHLNNTTHYERTQQTESQWEVYKRRKHRAKPSLQPWKPVDKRKKPSQDCIQYTSPKKSKTKEPKTRNPEYVAMQNKTSVEKK